MFSMMYHNVVVSVFRCAVAELQDQFAEMEKSRQAVIGIGLDLSLHYK
jgi:hypothetical protein